MQFLEQLVLWFGEYFMFVVALLLFLFFFIKSMLHTGPECFDCGGKLKALPLEKDRAEGTHVCENCNLEVGPSMMKIISK